MVVDTRVAVSGGAESAPAELHDGVAVGSFSLRLLAHNREPVELEVPSGMTLGELAQREGLTGWDAGGGDQRGRRPVAGGERAPA